MNKITFKREIIQAIIHVTIILCCLSLYIPAWTIEQAVFTSIVYAVLYILIDNVYDTVIKHWMKGKNNELL